MKKKKAIFEKKLKAYSVAAAGTLLLAPSANADVQYSGIQNFEFIGNGHYYLDIDGDATDDFRFNYGFHRTIEIVEIYPLTTDASWIEDDVWPANLSFNYLIQNALPTFYWYRGSRNNDLEFQTYYDYENGRGAFFNNRGYIGVRFRSNICRDPDYHYGWIQYDGDTIFPIKSGTIIDWAYEENCNTPILAGDTGAPPVSVPTLNQWGLFALIALLAGAGVTRLRKQEEA